jgi:hypothetical protein
MTLSNGECIEGVADAAVTTSDHFDLSVLRRIVGIVLITCTLITENKMSDGWREERAAAGCRCNFIERKEPKLPGVRAIAG